MNIVNSYLTHDEIRVVKKGEYVLFKSRFTNMSFFGDNTPNKDDYFFITQCNSNETTIPFVLVKLNYYEDNYVEALFNCDNFAKKPEYYM